ncbi:MAG: NTP transferase domain-containing protein [Chlorobi bacterium]|nr:NTP transferase domain-containing protein [Chlorobiota bacterium]
MVYSAIILAAGNSKRMNFPKAFLKDRNNYSFIANHINNYRAIGCNEIVVVVNSNVINYCKNFEPNTFNNCIVVTNNRWDEGRFYSVKLGVNALSDTDACFLQNVDNPSIGESDLKKILTAYKDNCWIAPEYEKQTGHPVLISNQIIQKIQKTESNNFKLNDFLNTFQRIKIEVNSKYIHLNINTLEEYKRFIN